MAAFSLATFVACVVVAHAAKPSVDPLSHMVSEYARYGPRAVITAGFCSWALSLGATAIFIAATQPHNAPLRALVALLTLGALGAAVLACFRTQTSAGQLAFGPRLSLHGRLHDLGSGGLTLALFAGACVSLTDDVLPARARRFVAALLGFAIASDVVLLLLGPQVGGLRQRLLLTVGCLWQLTLLRQRSPDVEVQRTTS